MNAAICIWCGGEIEGAGESVAMAQGTCKDCLNDIFERRGTRMSDFLNSLAVPIFVVDGEGRIVTANEAARKIVSKDLREIEGELGGDVFGCAYAHLPGGCGQTVHCKNCAIRRTVMATLETGVAQTSVPAYQDLKGGESGTRKVRFLISTERVGGAVMLRIDDVLAP